MSLISYSLLEITLNLMSKIYIFEMPPDFIMFQQSLVLHKSSDHPRDAKLQVKEYVTLKTELSILNSR